MPTSMWDLAKLEVAGQDLHGASRRRARPPRTRRRSTSLDEAKADEYFDKLIANDVTSGSPGNAHCMREVSAGRFAFGWTDTDDFNVALLQGKPVAMVYPDKGSGRGRRDVHPELARA